MWLTRIPVLPIFASVAIAAALAPTHGAQAAQAAPGLAWAVRSPHDPGRPLGSTSISGGLTGVSATSSTSAWAVGDSCTTSPCTLAQQHSLVLHWNGTAWSKATSPNPGPADILFGVSADSPTDAWAVGQYCPTSSCPVEKTLILHWNGAAWATVPSPSPGPTTNVLSAVSADSATDAWAVGSYCTTKSCDCTTTCAVDSTLILHWNGTSWSRATAPSAASDLTTLSGVSATSATSAWAVGHHCTSSSGCNDHTLILRWNGTSWSKITSPNPGPIFDQLAAVTATSATSAWAAGQYCPTSSCSPVDTLIVRWNGTSWSTVTSPNATARDALSGVGAAPSGDTWAVGNYCTSQCGLPTEIARTLTLHWTGTTWSKVTSPNTSAPINFLDGASTASATSAWAVGQYCTSIQCFVSHTLILHWNGASWSRG